MANARPINNIVSANAVSVNDVSSASGRSETQVNNASVASTEYWYEQSKYYAGQAAESAQQAQQDVDEVVANMQGIGTVHLDKDGRAITISTITYVHEQSEASDTWVIEHNLNKHPSVMIVDTAGTVFTAEVEYNDENTCTVYINGATKGIAYLN